MNQSEFQKLYLGSFDDVFKRQKTAFDALLAYELNCWKYESRLPKHLESIAKIPHNERMKDFAKKYNVTIEEMKSQRNAVDSHLKNHFNH